MCFNTVMELAEYCAPDKIVISRKFDLVVSGNPERGAMVVESNATTSLLAHAISVVFVNSEFREISNSWNSWKRTVAETALMLHKL